MQRLFDRVKQVQPGDGYRFDGVGADKSELVVRWSLHDAACPPITVQVENCTPPRDAALQLHVPSDFSLHCPGLRAVVDEIATALQTEYPVGNVSTAGASATLGVGVVGLMLVVGLFVLRCLRPANGKALGAVGGGRGDLAWITVVVVAATTWFVNLPAAVMWELGAAWFLFACLLYDRERLASASRAQRWQLFGLFCVTLLLHWWLSAGGPGDLHLNLASIWSASLEAQLHWGPAPVALFRLLGRLNGGVRDTHILWCNLILSSLLPVLLYGILSDLGVGKTAALLAAAIGAVHPLLIAFSGNLERQPTYLFAACGSILALLSFLQRGGGARLLAFVCGAVLATTSRPEGAQVLIVHAAVLLLVPAPRRARVAAAATLALLLALALGYTRYVLGGSGGFHSMLQPAGETVTGGKAFTGQWPFGWTVLASPDFTPLAWIVAWTAGLALGARSVAGRVALLALLGLDVAWRWTGVYALFVGYDRQVASARYETILLVPFVIGTALLVEAVMSLRRPWKLLLAAAFVVCTGLTLRRPYEVLIKPFTIDYEYRFLKTYALTLPPQARVYVLDAPFDDVGFMDAHRVAQFVGSPVRFTAWSERRCDASAGAASDTYLYIGSACAQLRDEAGFPLPAPRYAQWIQDCAALRARVGDHSVQEVDVPAHKMSWHDFEDRTVRLGLYELRDPSLCSLGIASR